MQNRLLNIDLKALYDLLTEFGEFKEEKIIDSKNSEQSEKTTHA